MIEYNSDSREESYYFVNTELIVLNVGYNKNTGSKCLFAYL